MRKMPQQPTFISSELLLLPKLSVLAFWKLQVSIHMFGIFKLSMRPKILKSSPTKGPKCCNNRARWTAKNIPSTCSSGPNELFELWQGGETPSGNFWLGSSSSVKRWQIEDICSKYGLYVWYIYIYICIWFYSMKFWMYIGLCLNMNLRLSNTCICIYIYISRDLYVVCICCFMYSQLIFYPKVYPISSIDKLDSDHLFWSWFGKSFPLSILHVVCTFGRVRWCFGNFCNYDLGK